MTTYSKEQRYIYNGWFFSWEVVYEGTDRDGNHIFAPTDNTSPKLMDQRMQLKPYQAEISIRERS